MLGSGGAAYKEQIAHGACWNDHHATTRRDCLPAGGPGKWRRGGCRAGWWHVPLGLSCIACCRGWDRRRVGDWSLPCQQLQPLLRLKRLACLLLLPGMLHRPLLGFLPQAQHPLVE